MRRLKWKGVNPNSWVRVGAALCATPPTPGAPFTRTYISFWYWHHFLMPKATREVQKRSRTATTVGQGKRLALVFLLSPVRNTQSSSACPQRGEKSGLAACSSPLPALHGAGVSAAPHLQAEDPKLRALRLWFMDFCSDWVCELISATHWLTWQDYLGTAQRAFDPKPVGFLCSPVRSCMSLCRQAHLPTPALLPNGLFFTPLTPDPAKMSGQGLSCLLRWALVGSTASQSYSSCLSPLQRWDSLTLPLSAQPHLGVLTEVPSGPGRGEGEKEHGPPPAARGCSSGLGARETHGWYASVSSPVVLASPPCARLATLGCHPGCVLPTVATSAVARPAPCMSHEISLRHRNVTSQILLLEESMHRNFACRWREKAGMPKACENLWYEDTAAVTPLFISFPFLKNSLVKWTRCSRFCASAVACWKKMMCRIISHQYCSAGCW